MEIYFDSKDLKCKTPFGAVDSETPIKFSVYCKDGVFIKKAYLVVYLDGVDTPNEYPLTFESKDEDVSCFSVEVDNLDKAYSDKMRWARMSLMNTANAGFFSSDRAVKEYVDRIWHLKPVKYPKKK